MLWSTRTIRLRNAGGGAAVLSDAGCKEYRVLAVDRRTVLAGLGAALIARPAMAGTAEPRELRLYNPHTDETYRDVYHNGEGYIAGAQDALNRFLRDHHADAAMSMDPRLFDMLWHLRRSYRQHYGANITVNVHSAYRTPETNARLRSEGAAQNSYHMFGKAVDVSAQGYGIHFLKDRARQVAVGGVGIYMRSRFAHLDTGPRRVWVQSLY